MSDRVRIGTCSGPADVALVRSMFAAHGIDVVIGGEQHASLLGGLGGGLVALEIWVAGDAAEAAIALLRECRNEDSAYVEPHDDEYEGFERQLARRRGTGIAIILALFLGFGTAHMYARAWWRGFALAVIEIVGFVLLVRGTTFGAAILGAAIATDAIGAVWHIRSKPVLPAARVV